MNDLLKTALAYRAAGLSIIGVKENKQSLHYWKKFQLERMPDELLFKTFNHPAVTGIGIVCGSISGNLEAIDVDSKYDLGQQLFDRYCKDVQNKSHDLLSRLVIASTKNKGYHFFYRCNEISNNLVLAKRGCSDTEKIVHPHQKIKVLIETRGEKGYVIVHPTPGYHFLQHDLVNIPVIEPMERKLLHDTARLFNSYHEPEYTRSIPIVGDHHEQSPFDDYNKRGDIIELLKRHGWKVVRQTHDKTMFRRPGNTEHESSGDYNHILNLFGVFSTSTEFQQGKGYRPYAVYAILECDGDFKLAAKRLIEQGYGTSYKKRS